MILSNFLGKEIDLRTAVATGSGSSTKTIVFHSDLEDFILNKIPKEMRPSWHFSVFNTNPNDCVALCSMYVNGRSIEAVGEATPSTLRSSVEKSFPTTTACNRAFDRAAIRFLGLGPNVYSNMEIEPDGPTTIPGDRLVDGQNAHSEEDTPSDGSKTPSNDVSNAGKVEATLNDKTCQMVAPTSGETDSETKVENAKDATDVLKECGSVVVDIGSYAKKGKTVAEIYEEKPLWLEYVVNNVTPSNTARIKQINAAKKYIELKKKES